MLTKIPGCRVVCDGSPGEDIDRLVVAFKRLRAEGLGEAEAIRIARDPRRIAAMLPAASLGALDGVAEAIVQAGCAECAVNLAYSD